MVGSFLRRGILVLAVAASLVGSQVASLGSLFGAHQTTSDKLAKSNITPFTFSGTSECPAPPAGWDPTTATAEQLQFYGLPLPHAVSGTTTYQNWLDQMHHATQRICGHETKSKEHTHTYASNGDIWSGYVVQASGFNDVNGNWTVPCYYGTSNSQRAIQWVGIGGYGSTHLWQAGTESDVAQGYRFWYEDVPNDPIIHAGPAVTCGNYVHVVVSYNYDVSGMAYVFMDNTSTGQYWSTTKSFVPSSNSAEWIVERPQCSLNHNYALAITDNVNWSAAGASSTNYGNTLNSISYFPYQRLDMYQDGVLLSSNSGLGSDGSTFTTYYSRSGVSYC